MVLVAHLELALVDLDDDFSLVVHGGGEGLVAVAGDQGVSRDYYLHPAALNLNSQGKWRRINQNDIVTIVIAGSHHLGSVVGGADGHDLIRIHRFIKFLIIEILLQHFLNFRNSC